MNAYFIGGSPCAGKSTVAEILSKQYGLYYFKVDERLDEYTRRGAQMNYEICKKQVEMGADQIWMRNPVLQCKEEFQISHFRQRNGIPYVLDGCSNLEAAFDNWMERDVLFAEEVVQECNVLGYQSIRNNGELSIEELVHKVSIHFGLAG